MKVRTKTRKTAITVVLVLAFSLLGLLAGCQSTGSGTQPENLDAGKTATSIPAIGAPGGAVEEQSPAIVVTPTAGVLGTDIKVSGKGFVPGEDVALTLNKVNGSANLAIVTADKTGGFGETSVKFPGDLTVGSYLVGASGIQSGRIAEGTFRLRQDGASMDLDKYTGSPGLPLGVKGFGFAPGETVNFYFEDAPELSAGQATADDLGRINVDTLRLPFVSEGSHKLIASGQDSQVEVDRSFIMYGFHPFFVLEPYALAPGASMDLKGQGFVPDETVTIYLDNKDSEPLLAMEADWEGKVFWRNALTADPSLIGQHKLIVIGDKSNEEAAYAFEVTQFYPNIDLIPYAGPPGTKVAIDAQAFAPNETVRVFTGDEFQKTEVSSFQADKNGFGRIAGEFVIPYGTRQGALPVTVVGDASRSPVVRNFGVLAVEPWISLSDYAGTEGKQINLKGGGFGTGENISIFVGPEKVATVVADMKGEFQGAGPFVIPTGSGSSVNIVATGDLTGGKASAKYTVVRQPQ